MKLLVFEFICGGGLAGQPLPVSLLQEGRMMVQSLLQDLKHIPVATPVLMLDSRCITDWVDPSVHIVPVHEQNDFRLILSELLGDCDIFWPIAPESDNMLGLLADLAIQKGKRALISSPETLAICKSKILTAKRLQSQGIATITTRHFSSQQLFSGYPVVIKPDQGVGCEATYRVDSATQLAQLIQVLERHEAQPFVVQPFIAGLDISLSCLFSTGQGQLICCNRQYIAADNGRLVFKGCQVNVDFGLLESLEQLVASIAGALPGLWGYIGIDCKITPENRIIVIEINPRLTTSYCAIHEATGINVAAQVLALENTPMPLKHLQHRQINVHLDPDLK